MRAKAQRSSLLVAVGALLCLLLTLSPVVTRASPAGERGVTIVPTEACSCSLRTSGAAAGETRFQGHGPPILSNYDEQVGITFTQSFTSIEYNVTAIEQTDPLLGTGPAYLVNGLSDTGYWYQVGVSWDWAPGQSPGTGFDMNYEVFDTGGSSIFPSDGQGGVASFSGPVNAGDIVLLDLYFSDANQSVTMLAEDTDTKAVASETFSGMGATFFVGLPSYVANSNGFFTGLMTEWYHGAPYYDNEAPVVYSNPLFELTSGWMWMDEFDADTFQGVFSSNTTAPVSFADPTVLQEFSFNGTTEYADAFEFVTGALSNSTLSSGVPLVLSFSVKGGGTGYSAPDLTYASGGKTHTVPLTGSPAVYFADMGTTWTVSATLGGSSSQQRWQTGQVTTRSANSSESIVFVYRYQELVTFGFSVVGGGSGFSPPSVTYVSLGASATTQMGVGVWADVGSRYAYSSPLNGSTAAQRWSSDGVGSIGSSHQLNAVYYRQYLVTFDVSFKDTEVFPGVSLASTSTGRPYSATLVQGANKEWLDSGASYAVPQSFSLESGQRLLTNGTTAGTVSASVTVGLVYDRQFYIRITQSSAAGGTVSPLTGWYDSGALLQLDAVSSSGWHFEAWQGAGSDSVSGSQAELELVVGPGTPANETAVFYPGVAVDAAGPSSLSYSDGPVSGTVSGGTSTEVYVPPSSTLKITGSSVPFLTGFTGWSGASNSTSTTVSILVSGPAAVRGVSTYDYLGIGTFAILVALIVAATFALVRRRGYHESRHRLEDHDGPSSGESSVST
jgi:hypothetical protein